MTDVVSLACLADACLGSETICCPPAMCMLRAHLTLVRRQQEDDPVVWPSGGPTAICGNRWIMTLADIGLVEWEPTIKGVIARACQVEGA